MQIYVILFNAETDNEGIYSMRIGERDVILMFKLEDDATRFALMLEAQDFPPATVEAFDPQEIQEFCAEAGYEAEIIEEGMLALPPESNVEDMEWSPEGKPESEFVDTSLDDIRRRLEGLL